MSFGGIVFWITLFFGFFAGVYVFGVADPPQHRMFWAALYPVFFIVVAFVIVLFILEAIRAVKDPPEQFS